MRLFDIMALLIQASDELTNQGIESPVEHIEKAINELEMLILCSPED